MARFKDTIVGLCLLFVFSVFLFPDTGVAAPKKKRPKQGMQSKVKKSEENEDNKTEVKQRKEKRRKEKQRKLKESEANESEAKESEARESEVKESEVKESDSETSQLFVEGQLSYQNYKISGDGAKIQVSGWKILLPVKYQIPLIPETLGALLQGGLGFSTDDGSSTISGSRVKFAFNPVFIHLGVGLAYRVFPNFNLEPLISYDIGFTGNAEAKSRAGSTGYDIVDYKRLNFGLNGRIFLSPDFALGFGLTFFSGNIQFKNLNEGEVEGSLSQNGNTIDFAASYRW